MTYEGMQAHRRITGPTPDSTIDIKIPKTYDSDLSCVQHRYHL